jgi:hypothetical protein
MADNPELEQQRFFARVGPGVQKKSAEVFLSRGSNNWILPSIYDYCDQRVSAIENISRTLPQDSSPECERSLTAIRAGVTAHVAPLTDEELCLVAWTVADDFYKAANAFVFCDKRMTDYLEATAGIFFYLLRQRGYAVHYLVDNVFGETLGELERPLKTFPDWCRLIGFRYICPQQLAVHVMKAFGADPAQLRKFTVLGRRIAERIVKECDQNHDSYLLLDTDPDEADWAVSHFVPAPGIISIHRAETAKPGTGTRVEFPRVPFSDDA